MAFQATVPLIIMTGALTFMGHYCNFITNKRECVEKCKGYEHGLKHYAGIIPPRTRVAPYIPHEQPDILKGREIPIYSASALLNFIEPGSKLDPYANPRPTQEQLDKERQRILKYCADHGIKIKPEEIYSPEQLKALKDRDNELRNQVLMRDPERWRYAEEAHYYRVKAFEQLHAQEGIKIDEDKVKEEFQKHIDAEARLKAKIDSWAIKPIDIPSTPYYPLDDVKKLTVF